MKLMKYFKLLSIQNNAIVSYTGMFTYPRVQFDRNLQIPFYVDNTEKPSSETFNNI